MKAVVFERYGLPADVLHSADVPMPEPSAGEVRVRMIASPINPSDLLSVRGQYGKSRPLPATPGFEGVGTIDKSGPGLLHVIRGLKTGKRVAVLNGQSGNWQEYVVLSARQVVPLPDNIPDVQAASFFVNPATAVVMIQDVLQVPRGSWLLQTAAGSALGRMIIRLSRYLGIRTINLVRRAEQVEELRGIGGDEVLATSETDLEDRLRQLTQDKGVPFALDAVGGAMGEVAFKALGSRGRLLVYGALSGEPIPVDPRIAIGGQKSVEGFWLSEWVKDQSVFTMLQLFRRVIRLHQVGILATPTGATFPLDRIQEAVREAEKPGRAGKVLLQIRSPG